MINMLLNELIPLYDRDLKALRLEIESYSDEASIWKIAPGINNPGGNEFMRKRAMFEIVHWSFLLRVYPALHF